VDISDEIFNAKLRVPYLLYYSELTLAQLGRGQDKARRVNPDRKSGAGWSPRGAFAGPTGMLICSGSHQSNPHLWAHR
jgi:hypothetical protein